nr:MAG TPA: hypothetical protein [Caudoviricetes sp.]
MKISKSKSIHAMRDELLEDDREEIEYYDEPVIERVIEIDLYDVEVLVEPDGSIYAKNDDYSWAKHPSSKDGDWYDDDFEVTLLSYEDAGNYVLDLIEKYIPNRPGIWVINGSVTLICDLINLQSDQEWDEVDRDFNTRYITDDVVVEVDFDKSKAENIEVDFIGWEEDY